MLVIKQISSVEVHDDNDENDDDDDDDADDDGDTSDGGVGGSNYLLPSLPCHSPLPLWEHVRQTLS